jgi:hypothetical protein
MQGDSVTKAEWVTVHRALARSTEAAEAPLAADGAAVPAPVAARVASARAALDTVLVHTDMGLLPHLVGTTSLRNAWIVKPNHLSKGNGGLCRGGGGLWSRPAPRMRGHAATVVGALGAPCGRWAGVWPGRRDIFHDFLLSGAPPLSPLPPPPARFFAPVPWASASRPHVRTLPPSPCIVAGIQCFNNPYAALRYAAELGFAVIAQKYIERPLLVRGRKVRASLGLPARAQAWQRVGRGPPLTA